mgnify:CR=1 FL=1
MDQSWHHVLPHEAADTAGNNNAVSNTFTWTYDSTALTITIASTTSGVTSGSTTNDASIAVLTQ